MNRMSKRKKRRMPDNPPAPAPKSDKPREANSEKADDFGPIGPVATVESLVAPNHQAHAEKSQSWGQIPFAYLKQNSVGLVSGIAAVVAAVYTFVQANISEKALLIGQRAFVHLEGIDHSIADNWDIHIESNGALTLFNAPRNLGKMVRTTFRMTNAGNTPTRNIQVMLHCQLVAHQQVGSLNDPFTLLKWNEADVVRRSIGAHQTLSFTQASCDFKNSDVLLNAQMMIVPVFLIGDVKYEDWIEPGITHHTQFAHRLVVHEVGTMPGFEGMDVTTEPVGKHNCTDEDCPP
jgi:hypothetical protein